MKVNCGRCGFELPEGVPAPLRPIPERFDDRRLPVCAVCMAAIDGAGTLERLAAGVAAVDRAVARQRAIEASAAVVDDGDIAEAQGHPLAAEVNL